MILVVYGTTGELIKLAPLLRRLSPSQALTVCTNQQADQLPEMHRRLDLEDPDFTLTKGYRGRDLSKPWHLVFWAINLLFHAVRLFSSIRSTLRTSASSNLTIVHGDTLTTVLGCLLGKALGTQVAHVEAGLRSFDWRHPFPEELDRIITSKLADINYAPGQKAVQNLAGERGEVIDTYSNTVVDALTLASDDLPSGIDIPERYALVSLHRNELVSRKHSLEVILARIDTLAEEIDVLFVDHPVTRDAIDRFQLGHFTHRIRRIPKLPYLEFVPIIRRALCVITDSGGLQEECAALGVPCLVHRKVTEREDGLGSNVLLSKLDMAAVDAFLRDPQRFRKDPMSNAESPTRIILDDLVARGFLSMPRGAI